jgi:subfamily B ATP-binding cassette protein MsbA
MTLLAWLRSRARFYLRAMGYFRPDWPKVALLLVAIGVSTLVGLLQVWPMAMLVDTVLAQSPKASWLERLLLAPFSDDRLTQVIVLAVATLALRLIQELLGLVRSMLNLVINNNGTLRIRCDLFQKLQSLSLSYHCQRPQGDAIYRLNQDTNGCQGVLNVSLSVAVAAVTLVVMLWIMLARSLELTLVALTIAPVLLGINVWFGRMLKDRSLKAKEFDTQFTATIQRSMAAMPLIQSFGREHDEFGRFRTTAVKSIGAWFRFHWGWAMYRLLVGTLFGGGAALIFGYGGYLVYRDQFLQPQPGGMTLGDLIIFLTYLGMFYDPLCQLSGAAANVQEGVAGTERVFEVLDWNTGIEDAPHAISLPRQPRTLTLSNIGFAYDNHTPVLRGISATILPGQMVAFVGSSGVGKSTLLNLLPRFYDPTAGSLQLDGRDLRDVKLRDVRRHVALVLQKSILLPTTVAENIAYGRPDATDAEIHAAAALAGAAAFIDDLPGRYDFQISEEGQNLSGGQRQRIAIARALLTEAPIIVLDEPTSALDPQHEQRITATLRQLRGRRTIVLVSHRLSTVLDCDQIFVMDEGRIVEQGTHQDLLARHGVYYQMARHQLQLDDAPSRALAAA